MNAVGLIGRQQVSWKRNPLGVTQCLEIGAEVHGPQIITYFSYSYYLPLDVG